MTQWTTSFPRSGNLGKAVGPRQWETALSSGRRGGRWRGSRCRPRRTRSGCRSRPRRGPASSGLHQRAVEGGAESSLLDREVGEREPPPDVDSSAWPLNSAGPNEMRAIGPSPSGVQWSWSGGRTRCSPGSRPRCLAPSCGCRAGDSRGRPRSAAARHRVARSRPRPRASPPGTCRTRTASRAERRRGRERSPSAASPSAGGRRAPQQPRSAATAPLSSARAGLLVEPDLETFAVLHDRSRWPSRRSRPFRAPWRGRPRSAAPPTRSLGANEPLGQVGVDLPRRVHRRARRAGSSTPALRPGPTVKNEISPSSS